MGGYKAKDIFRKIIKNRSYHAGMPDVPRGTRALRAKEGDGRGPLKDRRQVDLHPRHIDALARPQRAAPHELAHQLLVGLVRHAEDVYKRQPSW